LLSGSKKPAYIVFLISLSDDLERRLPVIVQIPMRRAFAHIPIHGLLLMTTGKSSLAVSINDAEDEIFLHDNRR
jgi:hypothetical protein